jgi:8-oxo-dGTP diphosphatase
MYLPYTLCFCIQGDNVLMLYRYNPPNKDRWNGLGGKIESEERPLASAKRELFEEAGLRTSEASSFYFAGIVTWTHEDIAKPLTGMYTFIADFPSDARLTQAGDMREGRLAWKPVGWVCDKQNAEVVENIPYFLSDMFDYNIPLHYHFNYRNQMLSNYSKKHLPSTLSV